MGCLSQRLIYRLQDAGEIAIDVTVPEAENTKARPPQRVVTILVLHLVNAKIVLPAVDFDNETMFQTDKVNNEPLPRRLPAKVIAPLPP